MNVARIYIRVSTAEQDLTRQAEIEHRVRAAGYYIAGVYREKASGARADRPELLRMIADLQPGEVVVAEKIDRISRLTDGSRADAMTDEELTANALSDPDNPPLPDDFFEKAKCVRVEDLLPATTERVCIRLDHDVLVWFRAQKKKATRRQ